jgi:hypothetical protein
MSIAAKLQWDARFADGRFPQTDTIRSAWPRDAPPYVGILRFDT